MRWRGCRNCQESRCRFECGCGALKRSLPELPPSLLLLPHALCSQIRTLREVLPQHALRVVTQLHEPQLVVAARHDEQGFFSRRRLLELLHGLLRTVGGSDECTSAEVVARD